MGKLAINGPLPGPFDGGEICGIGALKTNSMAKPRIDQHRPNGQSGHLPLNCMLGWWAKIFCHKL
jgi:hypothetical protein